MAVYPGAFVDLYTEHLTVISPVRQLRIYCAGVWHNAVLVFVGLVFLWSLPYLLVPIYVTGQGAVVVNVLKVSKLQNIHVLLVVDPAGYSRQPILYSYITLK